MEARDEVGAWAPQHRAIRTANYSKKPQRDAFTLSKFYPKKQRSWRWSDIDSCALNKENHHAYSHRKRQLTTVTPRTETHSLSPPISTIYTIIYTIISRTILSKRVSSRTSSEFALFLIGFLALSALDFVGNISSRPRNMNFVNCGCGMKDGARDTL